MISVYKLESVSEGRAISYSSSSMPLRPALLISVWCITGSSINCLTFFIDQVLSDGKGLSWKISSLSCLSEGHSAMKWWKVSISSSQNLQTFDIVWSILFWCFPKKLCPVIALTRFVKYPLDNLIMPDALLGSGLQKNNLVCVCQKRCFISPQASYWKVQK